MTLSEWQFGASWWVVFFRQLFAAGWCKLEVAGGCWRREEKVHLSGRAAGNSYCGADASRPVVLLGKSTSRFPNKAGGFRVTAAKAPRRLRIGILSKQILEALGGSPPFHPVAELLVAA